MQTVEQMKHVNVSQCKLVLLVYYIALTACTNCNINGTLDEICDRVTGNCLCRENVAGPDCDSCVLGYYGNLASGVNCTACPCLLNNSYNSSCYLDDDGQPTCDSCKVGYAGRRCDVCDNGYFGDPQVCSCSLVLITHH